MSESYESVAIVTGGAKGIGRAISLAFANSGAHVMCADMDIDAGKQLEQEALKLSGAIEFFECDVSKSANCKALIDAAARRGNIQVVCNNAGIQPHASFVPAHELDESLWDSILSVNLKSAFLTTKYAVPEMKAHGGGVIINIASVQALQSTKASAAYAASKGGILSLTRQLALEYAADNIRVLAINPGVIETPLVADVLARAGDSENTLRKGIAAAHPLERLGRPEDVASLALFLASDEACFMTGEDVCVDGGLMAKGAWYRDG